MSIVIVADSINIKNDRLTTFELILEQGDFDYPLWFASHRMLSVWIWRRYVSAKLVRMIVSATEWGHFLSFQHPDLVSEMADLSKNMRRLMDESEPRYLRDGEWHTPYASTDPQNAAFFVDPKFQDQLLGISAARCVAGKQQTYEEEIQIHDELLRSGSFSALEHVAQAMGESRRCGNFVGWKQYRKFQPNENRGRNLDVSLPVNTGYTPLYARMEQAFREHLISEYKDQKNFEVEHLIKEFFPRDAEKLKP